MDREWSSLDKSEWGPGEWQSEPDKKQWVDAATGLDCLIVRNTLGNLCGYVGVPIEHPWFGKDYSGCLQPNCASDWHHECSPGGAVEVHGGLTYADACQEPTAESWQKMRSRRAKCEEEAVKYPRGDSAKWLKRWGPVLDDFASYHSLAEASSICHTAGPDRPNAVWWFGFDCAHSGDYSPGMRAYASEDRGEAYRNIGYVERECASLARQIQAAGQPKWLAAESVVAS